MYKVFLLVYILSCYSFLKAQTSFCVNINAKDFEIGDIDVALDDGDCVSNFVSWHEFVALSWTSGGVPIFDRSLIKYDISFIPGNANIDSAFLTLYKHPAPTSANGDAFNGDCSFLLQQVTDNWIPNTVNWCNQPNVNTANEILVSCNSFVNLNEVKINVSDMLSFMHQNGINYGFKIRMQTEQPFNSATFVSSNHPNDNLWPNLKVCYTIPVGFEEIHDNLKCNLKAENGVIKILVNKTTLMHANVYNSTGKLMSAVDFTNQTEITNTQFAGGFYIVEVIDYSTNKSKYFKVIL